MAAFGLPVGFLCLWAPLLAGWAPFFCPVPPADQLPLLLKRSGGVRTAAIEAHSPSRLSNAGRAPRPSPTPPTPATAALNQPCLGSLRTRHGPFCDSGSGE